MGMSRNCNIYKQSSSERIFQLRKQCSKASIQISCYWLSSFQIVFFLYIYIKQDNSVLNPAPSYLPVKMQFRDSDWTQMFLNEHAKPAK